MRGSLRISLAVLLIVLWSSAQEEHKHSTAEQLGQVSFPISCSPAVQDQFNKGMAQLHSFDYGAARKTFDAVAERDPRCAMAHWGIALSYFRQLWEPPLIAPTIPIAGKEIKLAAQIGAGTPRETEYIHALGFIYEDASAVPYRARVSKYEQAMHDLASANRNDVEAQILYALALLASAPPSDKSHVNQKQAAEILEPLSRSLPQHPGIPHYLIHAYDNAELAAKGLAAARTYSQIAPSAPHALHMPSHIFTRLGLWEDSIQANLAAKAAAHQEGDTGEELHAMDYLVYAYLQMGRERDAATAIAEFGNKPKLSGADFKVAYAWTAMPIRYALERRQWAEAAAIIVPSEAPSQVVAIAVWARGIGFARSGRVTEAREELVALKQIEAQLRASASDYWANQTGILVHELAAWCAQGEHKPEEAAAMMRQAADDEDAVEKLPVTPGPIIPAREQLGDLLLEQNHPEQALIEFKAALLLAPGRRGSIQGAARAAELSRSRQGSL
jgi:tetratricopeptide (TPR) repeat protein